MSERQSRNPWHMRLLSAFFAIAFIGGAAAQSDLTPTDLAQFSLAGLPIKFIGPYQSGYADTAERALTSAVTEVTDQGISLGQIERITITPAGIPQEDKPLNLPPFRIWVTVEGCEEAIYFRVSPTGRIIAMNDEGGCLSRG